MKKNLMRWLITLAVLLPCLLISASAASGEVIDSGYCGGEGDGSNLTWTLYSDGELVIAGSGAMADWSGKQRPPWYSMKGNVTALTIGSDVTSIGAYAFVDFDKLPSVIIPNSVTAIGNLSFYDCNALTSVTIPNGVTSIGDMAFQQCSSLTSVTIPDSVTSLGEYAFYWCDKLTSATIGNGVTAIKTRTFYNCTNLSSLKIGRNVTSIAGSAFYNCMYLTEVTLPESVTTIGASAFKDCKRLASITIPNSVTTIGESAFYECSGLTSVTLPNNLTQIEDYTFSNCYSLPSITIPDSVISIGVSAFENCERLTDVTIPANVLYIVDMAFKGCSRLTRVEFMGDVLYSARLDMFNNCNSALTLYYHEGTTGWTSSKYYDPAAGTWCGRPLVMIKTSPSSTITGNGRSLSLEGEIFINQYFKVAGFQGVDISAKAGLLVWDHEVTAKDAVYGSQTYIQTGAIYDAKNDEYMVRTAGISAKEYADELYIRPYIEVDGNYVYGELAMYSVQTYCQNQLNKTSASAVLKQLCAQMLHYGAAAQKRFNYNVTDLANANILDSYPAPDWMKC